MNTRPNSKRKVYINTLGQEGLMQGGETPLSHTDMNLWCHTLIMHLVRSVRRRIHHNGCNVMNTRLHSKRKVYINTLGQKGLMWGGVTRLSHIDMNLWCHTLIMHFLVRSVGPRIHQVETNVWYHTLIMQMYYFLFGTNTRERKESNVSVVREVDQMDDFRQP